ncbi:MAG: type II toxin-antitoxin system VapC family toxin [Candidatus Schekmanbacteria bacterium]|nr:type II toxin-antitoxin system VapC family toxin [Candidatus Schekmanbacteria bacterium]
MRIVKKVLDSYSLIAFFEGEAGKDKMVEIFQDARDSGRPALLSVVNWGEIYYITLREDGRERADQLAHLISTLPIELIPADLELARQAAEFKAVKKMSYADCFAAALAKLRKAELVTGDKEFRQVEGELKIHWL